MVEERCAGRASRLGRRRLDQLVLAVPIDEIDGARRACRRRRREASGGKAPAVVGVGALAKFVPPGSHPVAGERVEKWARPRVRRRRPASGSRRPATPHPPPSPLFTSSPAAGCQPGGTNFATAPTPTTAGAWSSSIHLLPVLRRLQAIRDHHLARRSLPRRQADRASETDRARAAGATLIDHAGRPRRGLSNESINKTLALLATMLDDAVERGMGPPTPHAGAAAASEPRDPREPSSSPMSSAISLPRPNTATPVPEATNDSRDERSSPPSHSPVCGSARALPPALARHRPRTRPPIIRGTRRNSGG